MPTTNVPDFQQLQTFFNNSIDLLCIATHEGRFVLLNAEWTRTLGYPVENLVGTMFIDLVHPDDRETTIETLGALAARKPVLHFKNRFRHNNGTWRWLEWHSFLNENMIYASARDVTNQISMLDRNQDNEQNLRETTTLLESVLNSIPDIIGLQHPDHRIIKYNQAGYQFLGVEPDAAIGKRCFELIGRDRPCEQCATAEAMKTGNTARLEKYLPDLDTWLDCRSYPVKNSDGKITYIVEHLRDITEIKKAHEKLLATEQQLFQTEKLKTIGQLAGGVAHDFNNQLAGIQGYIELMRLELDDDHKLQQMCNEILECTTRGADLTSQLLAYARKGRLATEVLDLAAMIASVTGILQRSIPKMIELQTRIDTAGYYTNGDPTLVQNAILNLALNARDAIQEKGRITFELSKKTLNSPDSRLHIGPGDYCTLKVHDTGSGIDKTLFDKIFEPFFTTKDRDKGTGMGLSAVQGTMINHQGAVDVSSKPGEGTTFTLYFPSTEQKPTDAKEPEREIKTSNKTTRIMLIDDEPVVCKSTSQLLKSIGYDVASYTSPGKALEDYSAHNRDFDIIILDMIMPDVSGSAVFKKVLAINPEQKVLIMSGYTFDQNVRELMNRGACGFIQKPFSIQDLDESIETCMGRSGE
jgi:two-component system cell cycle sensor histidine kinase/response regulator CckA